MKFEHIYNLFRSISRILPIYLGKILIRLEFNMEKV